MKKKIFVGVKNNRLFWIHKLQYFMLRDEKAIARRVKKVYDRNITITGSLVEQGGPYEG